MLIDRYEQDQLLFNANLKGNTTQAGIEAYRGDLVLEEGEIADAMGRRKPPHSVVKQVALLASTGKLTFVSGFLEKIEGLPLFADKYAKDMAADATVALFVENIAKPMLVEYQGIAYTLLPMLEGENTVWNELMEMLGLEKGDFKGQSAEDKVITMYESFKKDYTSKAPKLSIDEAIAQAVEVKKEARVGPV